MKINQQILFFFSLIFFGLSCSKDVAADAVPTNEREPITFNVSNETITRGAIVTEITEFVVYAVDSEGTVVIDNATFTKNETSGSFETNETLYWNGNEIKFYAYLSSSNFTAAEGTTLSYQMPTDVTTQDDLMVAQFTASSGAVTLSFERIMALIQFSVKDASYAVTSVAISGISDAGAYDMATKAWSSNEPTNTTYTAGIDTTVADGGDEGTQITNNSGYLMVLPQSQASVTVTATNENGTEKVYTLANINWEAGKLYNYTINLEDIEPQVEDDPSNDDENVKAAADDYDLTEEESANCYMLHPSSSSDLVYYIPVEERINTFWGNNGYENVSANCIDEDTIWTAEILWGDVVSFGDLKVERVTSTEFDGGTSVNSVLKVTLPKNYNNGNVIVAVKSAEGTILWSWHLWITDYNPDEANDYYMNNNSYHSVTGGQVERLYNVSGAVLVNQTWSMYFVTWSTGSIYGDNRVHMMDRFLGAIERKSSDYSNGYYQNYNQQGPGALYFQFGRKDPFPGDSAKNANGSSYSLSTISSTKTMQYTVNNPMNFVTASGKWISDTTGKYYGTYNYWYDYKSQFKEFEFGNPAAEMVPKSIFDPCPVGWRIPFYDTWNACYNSSAISKYSNAFIISGAFYYYNIGYRGGGNGGLLGSRTATWTWSNYNDATLQYYNSSVAPLVTDTYASTALPVRPVRDPNNL